MVQRVTYPRRHSYNTTSNKVRKIKTPGGVLKLHIMKKRAKAPKCGDCGGKIIGVPCVRPIHMNLLKKRQRKVTRPYGGSRCSKCVRNRISRAFLVEEAQIVKSVMKEKLKKIEK